MYKVVRINSKYFQVINYVDKRITICGIQHECTENAGLVGNVVTIGRSNCKVKENTVYN